MGLVLAPFFNIGLNLAILRSSGKLNNFIDKFIIFLNGRANTSAPFLRNFAETSFIPAALPESRRSKIFLITSSNTFENSKSLGTLHEVLVSKFVGCPWHFFLEASG